MAQNQVLDQLLDSLPQLLLGMRQINVDEMKIMREMDQEDRRISLDQERQQKTMEWGQDYQDMANKKMKMWINQQEMEPDFIKPIVNYLGDKKKYEDTYREKLAESQTWGDRFSRAPISRMFDTFNLTGLRETDEESARRRTREEVGNRPTFDYDDIPDDINLETFNRITSSPYFREAFMSSELMQAMLRMGTTGNQLGLMQGTVGTPNPYGFGNQTPPGPPNPYAFRGGGR